MNKHCQIISDIRIKMVKAKRIYPSLEWVTEENPYNNKDVEEQEFQFTKRKVSKRVKNISETMDVFDGI